MCTSLGHGFRVFCVPTPLVGNPCRSRLGSHGQCFPDRGPVITIGVKLNRKNRRPRLSLRLPGLRPGCKGSMLVHGRGSARIKSGMMRTRFPPPRCLWRHKVGPSLRDYRPLPYPRFTSASPGCWGWGRVLACVSFGRSPPSLGLGSHRATPQDRGACFLRRGTVGTGPMKRRIASQPPWWRGERAGRTVSP